MRHLEGTARLTRYRAEWPDLFEAADEMVAVLDTFDPPRPLPACGECDRCMRHPA